MTARFGLPWSPVEFLELVTQARHPVGSAWAAADDINIAAFNLVTWGPDEMARLAEWGAGSLGGSGVGTG